MAKPYPGRIWPHETSLVLSLGTRLFGSIFIPTSFGGGILIVSLGDTPGWVDRAVTELFNFL